MPPKSRLKTAAPTVPVPQNREQATAAIARLGVRGRELVRLEADMNDALAEVRKRFEDRAEPLRLQQQAETEGVQIWAEAHREALTQGGKVKTAALSTGEIAWRTRPPSVRVTGAEAVMAALRRLGLTRFIRIKEEVNKEAILNESAVVAQVPGISISQGEDFVVTPFELELAEGD